MPWANCDFLGLSAFFSANFARDPLRDFLLMLLLWDLAETLGEEDDFCAPTLVLILVDSYYESFDDLLWTFLSLIEALATD